MTLKVLELFCGAGSFSVNLNSNKIKHEIVGFCDTRQTAIQLFCKLHNKNIEDNLGDVRNVTGKDVDVDLIVYGSPCQSFTKEGNREGGEKGKDTKSALMWEAVRIVEESKPKFVVWENVPDAVNKLHIGNFNNYIEAMGDIGYNTYYEILNAHELGSPQKRKRLFSVSIRKDIDNGEFKFNYNKISPRKLVEYIENDYPKELILEPVNQEKLILGKENEMYKIKNGTKLGYLLANEGDGIDFGFAGSKSRRGRVQPEACQTLLRGKGVGVIQNGIPRYLTPFEYWKLQEMPLDLYHHVESCNFKLKDQYDVIGGVINQLHLNVVFNSLAEAFKWERF